MRPHPLDVERSTENDVLVRCLDCGTEYRLAGEDDEAAACPHCGGIGWISLEAVRGAPASGDDS